jgi:hypothetical protein
MELTKATEAVLLLFGVLVLYSFFHSLSIYTGKRLLSIAKEYRTNKSSFILFF